MEVAYDHPCLADILINRTDPSAVILQTPIDNLNVIPSTIRLSKAAETMYNAFRRERRLKDALNGIISEKRYDVVFIDCPPSLGPLVENALTVADYCIVPCEPSSRSIDGLADLIDRIHEIRDGELDEKWFIVLSRVKKIARLTNEVIEGKLSAYRERICRTRIFERESINQAQIAGIPVFDFPRARAAVENLSEFAEELEGLCRIVYEG